MSEEYTYGRGETDGMFYIFRREGSEAAWEHAMTEVAGERVLTRFADELFAQHFVRDMTRYAAEPGARQEQTPLDSHIPALQAHYRQLLVAAEERVARYGSVPLASIPEEQRDRFMAASASAYRQIDAVLGGQDPLGALDALISQAYTAIGEHDRQDWETRDGYRGYYRRKIVLFYRAKRAIRYGLIPQEEDAREEDQE